MDKHGDIVAKTVTLLHRKPNVAGGRLELKTVLYWSSFDND